MGSVQVESSLTVVPPNGGGTLVGGRICLAVALLVGGSSWLDCLDLAQDVRSAAKATVIGCLVVGTLDSRPSAGEEKQEIGIIVRRVNGTEETSHP
ncbi:hypothetical protein THAOC_23128, partial [Thalassiosira oceanica]